MTSSSSVREGDWLGDYEIRSRLCAGGMAALFLAQRHGVAGVSRPVVIKVIHPHLAEDELMVRMFIDEARISSHIRHSNVVYVESFGEDEVVLRNFRGERYVYKQPGTGALPFRKTDPEYLFTPQLDIPKPKARLRSRKRA